MKNTLLLLILALVTSSIIGQDKEEKLFTLKGKIKNAKNPTVYLIYYVDGKKIKDSCKLKKEKFIFTGNIQEPTFAILKAHSQIMDDTDPNTVELFIEQGTITANTQYDHLKEIKITGSKTQIEYETLKKIYKTIDKKSVSLSEKFSNVNRQFIIDHPTSYVSAYILDMYKTIWNIDSVKSLYITLSAKNQNSYYARTVKNTIVEIDNNSEGKIASQFKAIDMNGDTLSLSNLKDKYVLLEFWGSWCVPCRTGMPHLIELFKKYNNNGFEVIAIAEEYDSTGASWRKAVEKDNTHIWHNILSGVSLNKDGILNESKSISKLFGVHVFPTKILIDKKGVIIGRYTGTEEELYLDEKLLEIFKF